MKNYKKYIFDLDYTLLIPDWSREDEFLKKSIPKEEQEEFFKQKQGILNQYEVEFPRYDFKTLSDYFKQHGFTVSEEVISGWMIHNGETIKDEVADGALELLQYLKSQGKNVVLLTSWFSGTQIPRLKRTGLYPFIDKIVAGEDAMKPDLESFELAIGDTPKEDCIMIGDSLRSDKAGADKAGIASYILTEGRTLRKFLEKLKESKKKRKKQVQDILMIGALLHVDDYSMGPMITDPKTLDCVMNMYFSMMIEKGEEKDNYYKEFERLYQELPEDQQALVQEDFVSICEAQGINPEEPYQKEKTDDKEEQ